MFSFYLYVYALASAILRHIILKKSEAFRLVIDNLGRVSIPELHAMPVHVECRATPTPV
jgi:hypothetical protein